MSYNIPGLREQATDAVNDMLFDKQLWLVVLSREQAGTTLEDCFLCSGLLGAIEYPQLSSLQPETLIEAVDEHLHYKYVDVEVMRVAAHAEAGKGCTRIVPDLDQTFAAPRAGMYRIAVHDETNGELMLVDLDTMQSGSTLSSLALKFEISAG